MLKAHIWTTIVDDAVNFISRVHPSELLRVHGYWKYFQLLVWKCTSANQFSIIQCVERHMAIMMFLIIFQKNEIRVAHSNKDLV